MSSLHSQTGNNPTGCGIQPATNSKNKRKRSTVQTFKLRHRAKGRTLLAILISVIYILADAAFGYMIFPYINVHYRRGSNTFAYLVVLPLIGLPFLVSLLYPSYTVRIDDETVLVSDGKKELHRVARRDIAHVRLHNKNKHLDIYPHSGTMLLRLEPLFCNLKWVNAKMNAIVDHLRDRFGGSETQARVRAYVERYIDFPEQ